MRRSLVAAVLWAVSVGSVPLAAAQQYGGGATTAEPAAPVVRGDVTRKISDRVFLIPDGKAPMVPNVGIVVGDKATLVVDPGMGPKSGAVVWWEAWRLSRGSEDPRRGKSLYAFRHQRRGRRPAPPRRSPVITAFGFA